jgi:hypothetical protein
VILLIAVDWLLCGAFGAMRDLNRMDRLSALDLSIAVCLLLAGPFGLLIHRVIYGR